LSSSRGRSRMKAAVRSVSPAWRSEDAAALAGLPGEQRNRTETEQVPTATFWRSTVETCRSTTRRAGDLSIVREPAESFALEGETFYGYSTIPQNRLVLFKKADLRCLDRRSVSFQLTGTDAAAIASRQGAGFLPSPHRR